jgi:hypothetical protein
LDIHHDGNNIIEMSKELPTSTNVNDLLLYSPLQRFDVPQTSWIIPRSVESVPHFNGSPHRAIRKEFEDLNENFEVADCEETIWADNSLPMVHKKSVSC